MAHEEYLRRNLVHAASVGVVADVGAVLTRLKTIKSAPKWLVEQLERTHRKSKNIPHDVALWRNSAPDAPSPPKEKEQ